MPRIDLPEPYSVSLARQSIRDSLLSHGEECVLLQMYHIGEDEGKAKRCPQCFAPGTLVRTANGYTPIEKIQVGDLVLTSDGTFHPVEQLHRRHFKGTAYEWQTHAMTSPVIGTGNHPMFALVSDHNHNQKAFMRDGVPFCGPSVCEAHHSVATRHRQLRGKSHDIAEVPLKNLNDRSWLVTMVPAEDIDAEQHQEWPLTEDFLWLIGYYIAEGSIGGGKWPRTITFASHRNEQTYRDRVAQIASDFGFSSIEKHKGENGSCISVYSARLARYLKYNVGSHCYEKSIPEKLMRLPAKKLMALVEGIWCGDGYKKALHEEYVPTTWDMPDSKRIGQTSEILALQIAEVVQRAGEQPTIHSTQSQALTPAGNQRKRCHHTGWKSNGKKQVKNRWSFPQGQELVRMKFVRPVEYDGIVYNLGVKDDHTYVVQNTLVHNCYDDIYKQSEAANCTDCFGTTFAGGVKSAVRVWGLFTDHVAAEQIGQNGVWTPDQRDVQTEPFPLLTEHDFIVRVRMWDSLHKPIEVEGYYGVQQVTRNSLRTGNRFGQARWDIVGQKATITELQKNSPIYSYPVVGVQFSDSQISRGVQIPQVRMF